MKALIASFTQFKVETQYIADKLIYIRPMHQFITFSTL